VSLSRFWSVFVSIFLIFQGLPDFGANLAFGAQIKVKPCSCGGKTRQLTINYKIETFYLCHIKTTRSKRLSAVSRTAISS